VPPSERPATRREYPHSILATLNSSILAIQTMPVAVSYCADADVLEMDMGTEK